MSKVRLIALAAGAATLLISTGTAVALRSNDPTTPSGPPASVESSLSTAEPTEPTETTEPTEATEPTETTEPTEPAPSTGSALTGREQAIRVALATTGGGTVTEVEAELEHGRLEWKIRILVGGQRIDVRVDAGTATVTRIEGGADDRRSGDHSGGQRGRH